MITRDKSTAFSSDISRASLEKIQDDPVLPPLQVCYAYVYICITYAYVCIYICIFAYVCVYIYIYIARMYV